jgi:hypothetical protein
MQLLLAGHSQFACTIQGSGENHTFSIVLNTRSGNVGASLDLVEKRDGNRKAVQKIQAFLDYLKNNRHIVATER